MSKKNKKEKKLIEKTLKLALATGIINLLTSAIDFINKLIK